MFDRIITLIDMDCFYCQVETRLNPSLKGKPVAVIQYNCWKGGGIVAVNYEARNLGVTRFMRDDEAKKQCPQLELVAVPDIRGKADLSRYRSASREVIAVLNEFSSNLEKASVDEAFLDLTDVLDKYSTTVTAAELANTFVVGYPDKEGVEQWLKDVNDGMNDASLVKLAQAAALVEKIRAAVFEKTGFQCSAGISHNKILAKLSCGLHKPNKQTVLPHSSIAALYDKLPVKKIRNLGGKFGDLVQEQLNCNTMGEIVKYSQKELQQKFGDKSGTWLYNIARGINLEPVKPRTLSKSIGCCKNFPGQYSLVTKDGVKKWLTELAIEVYERVQDDLVTNKRKATLVTVNTNYQEDEKTVVFSRSTTLNNFDTDEIVKKLMVLLSKINTAPKKSDSWHPPLNHLGISISKFVEIKDTENSLLNFFKPVRPADEKREENKPALRTSSPIPSTSALDEPPKAPSPLPSTSSYAIDSSPPPELDYRNSFFCKYFRDRPLFIPVPPKEQVSSEEEQEESTEFSVQAEVYDISKGKSCAPVSAQSSISVQAPAEQTVNDVDRIEICVQDESSNSESTECQEDLPTECCAECGKSVPLVDFLEHLDHHAALRLQREINRAEIASNAKPSGSTAAKGGEKRKYKKQKVRDSPAKKNQPITAYFSVKPSS